MGRFQECARRGNPSFSLLRTAGAPRSVHRMKHDTWSVPMAISHLCSFPLHLYTTFGMASVFMQHFAEYNGNTDNKPETYLGNYDDTLFRYLEFTGLFETSGRGFFTRIYIPDRAKVKFDLLLKDYNSWFGHFPRSLKKLLHEMHILSHKAVNICHFSKEGIHLVQAATIKWGINAILVSFLAHEWGIQFIYYLKK